VKSRTTSVFSIVVFIFLLAIGARSNQDGNLGDGHCREREHHAYNLGTPLKLVGGILVPGNPLHFDISWVDQETERYFLAEAGNGSVDIFDAENNLFLGRIGAFHGTAAPNDPCGRIDGMGPSGVMEFRIAWRALPCERARPWQLWHGRGHRPENHKHLGRGDCLLLAGSGGSGNRPFLSVLC
jgi:hypothetical protein